MRNLLRKMWDPFRRRLSSHTSEHPRRNRVHRLYLEPLEDRTLLANATGVVSGVAFVDANGNGQHDAGEVTLAAVPLTLTGTSAQGTPINASTSTDTTGSYSFLNVQPGTYKISACPAEGYLGGLVAFGSLTGPDGTRSLDGVTVAGGQSITFDVGYRGLDPHFISSRQLLNSTTSGAFSFAAAGDGQGLASDRANNSPIVSTPIADVSVGKNNADTTIDLAGNFSDPDMTDSMIRFDTSAGPINVELFDAAAPRTVANFFNYINDGRFNNSIFNRLLSGFVLQGGAFTFDSTSAQLVPIATDPAVVNEFGASNTLGTLAMAKMPGDPNSATSQFFFNLANNTGLDTQNGGFTVFGKVASDADQLVVNSLATASVKDEGGGDPNSPLASVPLVNYTGTNFPTDTTASNYDLIKDVVVVKRDEFLTYSVVSNTNTDLVATSVTNNRMTLHYTPGATGSATITVRATDRFGATVDATFNVTVANRPPTVDVSLNTNSPGTNDLLTATATPADPDGDPVSLTYEWSVDGVVQQTMTTTATTNSFALDQPGHGDKGQTVTVRVTPNDGTVDGTPASASATIVNSPPVITSLTLSPALPDGTQPLTATVVASDPDGDPFTLTYNWSVHGTVVQTTPNTTNLNDTFDLTVPGHGTAGDVINVSVTPSDAFSSGMPVSSMVSIVG
jgi:peptidyl-prolyl cis-trans isomerase A (cyclophilin A)